MNHTGCIVGVVWPSVLAVQFLQGRVELASEDRLRVVDEYWHAIVRRNSSLNIEWTVQLRLKSNVWLRREVGEARLTTSAFPTVLSELRSASIDHMT
jgi:hypothetical protein